MPAYHLVKNANNLMAQPADILFAADSRTRLLIDFSQQEIVFPPEVQQFMAARWQAYEQDARASQRMLFNGAVSLYRNHTVADHTLRIALSPGDYKMHLISAVRDRAWFTTHAPEFILPGLGNTVLLTAENQVLFGQRSQRVAAHPGKGHVFGGVLEQLGTAAFPASELGVLAHLEQELAEELALAPGDMIGTPQLLGLFRDPLLAQPELTWHWPCRLNIRDIRSRIVNLEHAELITLPLFKNADAHQRAQAAADLTPLALAAWPLAGN